MNSSNDRLVDAFPSSVREDALAMVSTLPEVTLQSHTFSVLVGPDTITIPYRIYHDFELIRSESLTPSQADLLDCLLTRHYSGFIREQYLQTILSSRQVWVPPFVIQLAGEYVVEIVLAIRNNLDRLDPAVYRAFLTQNLDFYELTKQRIISYWNCYHRDQQKTEYVGFQLLEAFDKLIGH